MQRGSDTHGPRTDDELKQETEVIERSGRPAHTEEWRQPEGPADDDPDVRGRRRSGPKTQNGS